MSHLMVDATNSLSDKHCSLLGAKIQKINEMLKNNDKNLLFIIILVSNGEMFCPFIRFVVDRADFE